MQNNQYQGGYRGPQQGGSYNPQYNRNKPGFNKNFGPRRNERIRAFKIRVIGPDGGQLGVMSSNEALSMARKMNLDLLEVSPNAEPPVCRILDYGKYKYEESKKQKSHKSAAPKVKEIKIRPMIGQNDYMTKIRNAERFLFSGNKLKLTMMLRGREMEYKDQAFNIVKKAITDLSHMGVSEFEPKMMGRNINASLAPVPQKQRKLKYSGIEEEFDEEDDSNISEDEA